MERKTSTSRYIISLLSSVTAKRWLVSLCGMLLIISIIFAANGWEVNAHTPSNLNTSRDLTLNGIILSLNVVFLFAFLASTLSIIKTEDK
ncbi:MAG: hypothetical protein ACO1N4_08150 [Pedobacter sp.]